MEKFLNCIKIAAIINFICALLVYGLFPKFAGLILFMGLLLLYFYKLSPSKLKQANVFILLSGIFLIFINFISGIFVLVGYDSLTNYLKDNKDLGSDLDLEVKKVDKEIRKIDILLKLGVFMVLASGIIFATTGWNEVSNLVKIIVLLFFGTIFMGLFIFSDKKLKIRKTSLTYWLLGLSFYLFTWISICHFEYFGGVFSYTNQLKDLGYFTTYFLLTLFIYFTSKKFNIKDILFFVYFGIYLCIYYFLNYIGIDYMANIIILTLISFICNLFVKNNVFLKSISKFISYAIICLVIKNYDVSTNVYNIVMSSLSIINLLVLSRKNKNNFDNIIISILVYIYIFLGLGKLDLKDYDCVVLISLFSICSILINYLMKNKCSRVTNEVVYSTTAVILFFVSLNNSEIQSLIVSSIYLVTNFINGIKFIKSDEKNIGYYIDFVPITLFISSVCILIDKYYYTVSIELLMAICSCIYWLLSLVFRNKHKEEYKVIHLLSVIITTFCLFFASDLVSEIIILVSSILLFIRNYISKDQDNSKALNIISYILLLTNIYLLGICLNNIDLIIVMSSIAFIYLILLILFRKNLSLKFISNLFIILPIYKIINDGVYMFDIYLILKNLLEFYLLYFVVNYLFKNIKLRNVLFIVGIILILLQVIFVLSLYVGIYVGVLGIILLFYGYHTKKYKYFFSLGIIVTLINLIYQLNELWEMIPFWLYLLLGGLLLIGFVTYKEIKKSNIKDK